MQSFIIIIIIHEVDGDTSVETKLDGRSTRAGSWSLRALRHESDSSKLYGTDLILVLLLLLPSLLRNVV